MFVDQLLAQRLERVEGLVGAAFVDARNSPDVEWREIGGAIANFDGVDSPMTQTFGLGVCGAVDLPAIEAFFNERGADTLHEVSPYAGIEVYAQLVARGYHPIEMSNVLVQPIAESRPASIVREIDPVKDGAVWAETMVNGWSDDPSVTSFIRSISELNLKNRRMSHYLVELDGAPVATASLGVEGEVALLAGASTIPSARRRGAQAALLATRLADARRRGCTTAMMVAQVGSASQRNAEREGFRVAYTRTKWRRAR